MKSFWMDISQCTGCAACVNACRYEAIHMEEDACGFCCPVIGSNCIDCGLCETVCKRRGAACHKNEAVPQIFAAWSLDQMLRYTSTSGGIFSEIAMDILDRGGCVAGAQYNAENMVEHVLIEKKEDVPKLRQSKYVQSDIGMVYRKILIELGKGRLVLFCGAPCQVAGLKAFLNIEYNNLITIDFICRGMNSPKAYRCWLHGLEERQQSKVVNVWFKYKMNGWKNSPRCSRIDFADGTNCVLDGKSNLYMAGYLDTNLYIRPSCGICEFKGLPRTADITVGDFWGVDPQLDDDKGTSLVMINSQTGKQVYDHLEGRIATEEKHLEDIVGGNVCLKESVRIHPKSREFLEALDHKSFQYLMEVYTKEGIGKKAKQKIKKLLNVLQGGCL